MNTKKTKSMVNAKSARERIQSGRWPCGCCGRGVGANFVLCTECNKWCNKRYSGLRNLRRVQTFVCPRCAREGKGSDGDGDDEGPGLVVNGSVLEEVEQLCYLDVLDCEAGVEKVIRARITAARRRWREKDSILVQD